jgi:hypothetical protein
MFGGVKVDLGSPSGADFAASAPSSQPFWRSIGLEYATIDLNKRHDANMHDPITDQVKAKLSQQFDLTVNTRHNRTYRQSSTGVW